MFGPTLVGPKVTLAPLGPEHLESYCRWFADPEVTRFLKLQAPPTLAEEQEWFTRTAASQVEVVWGIFADGQHLGSTAIRRIDWRNRRAITGIVIGERSWWGRGIATAAHALRTRYAFDELNLEKLVTTVMEGNTAQSAGAGAGWLPDGGRAPQARVSTGAVAGHVGGRAAAGRVASECRSRNQNSEVS